MPEQPTTLPQWATTAGNTTVPSAGEKAAGYQVSTKPAAKKMNWLFNLIYQWIQYLQAPVGTGAGAGVDATGGSTSGPGLKGTGGATNGKGVEGVGTGTGAGVDGTGGGTSGRGVVGTGGPPNGRGGDFLGDGTGHGVNAVGGDSSGTGVNAIGGGPNGKGMVASGSGTGSALEATGADGYGVKAISDTSSPIRSSLHIGPQDAESSSPAKGDVMVHSVTGGMRAYDGSGYRKVVRNLAHLESSTAVTGTSEEAFDESFTIPAGVLTVGDSLRLVATVNITSVAGGGNLDLRARIDGVSGGLLAIRSLVPPVVGRVRFEINMVIVSIGAGGTIRALTTGTDGVSGSMNVWDDITLPTIDTTGTNNLVITADWVSAGNSCELSDYVLDIAS